MFGRDRIKSIIPHREPFLFVDEILELVPGKKAAGLWTARERESFFAGHFPDYPVLPGVLIVESLAQVGAVALISEPGNEGKIVFFGGIDRFRFKREVRAGSTIRLELEVVRRKGPFGKADAQAVIGGGLVARGELTFALKDS